MVYLAVMINKYYFLLIRLKNISSFSKKKFLTFPQSWCDTCDTMLSNIDQLITRANSDKEKHLKHRNSLETEVRNIGKRMTLLVMTVSLMSFP